MQVGGTRLCEACSIDYSATAVLFPQCADDLDCGFALDRNEGRVDWAFDLIDGLHRFDATQLFALGMHGPDFSGEAKFARAGDGNGAFIAANEGDGARVEQAGESVGHG